MKTPEDEAFDDLARKQGMWGGGFTAKRQAAMDKINSEFHDEYIKYRTAFPKEYTASQPAQDGKCKLCVDGCAACDARAQPAQESVAWVGLTDADIERIKLMTYEKETNDDGEEQEAVNIDWLIKTVEHFCKEKNNGA
jgi:hypothetical protein